MSGQPPSSSSAQSSRGPSNSANGGMGGQSQADLNGIVIEYLLKKGYNRTEAVLRQELAGDDDGRPIVKRGMEGAQAYIKGTLSLQSWIEGSLDIYKPELFRLLWPVFVYSYLALVSGFYVEASKHYFGVIAHSFEKEHKDELRLLDGLGMPEHVDHSEIGKKYRTSKYRLTMSTMAHTLLIGFLEDSVTQGGPVIMNIIHNNINMVVVDRAADDRMSIIQMLKRVQTVDDFPGEDEGIPGHNPGSANPEQVPGSTVLTRLKLGPLPLEPELLGDVMAELEEIDAVEPPKEGQSSLAQHFENMIKREEGEDAPTLQEIPLPPSKARDVIMEVQKVRENRDRFMIEGRTGGLPAAVSVCMFTFHNTNDDVNCIEISDDNLLIAAGMAEHYIRVWRVDGKIIPSTIAGSQPQASRRLIGHHGPIYRVSFSPSIDQHASSECMSNVNGSASNKPSTKPQFLLSCSLDKTIRLWELNTWACLVSYEGHMGPIWDVTWGPFGYYFATGSRDGTARLWTTDHKSDIRIFAGHEQDVNVVCFHPNNAYIFTGGYDKTVRMWSITNGYPVRMFTGHAGDIGAIACAPNGKILATADDTGTIILWDLLPGRLLKRMRGHDKGGILSLGFNAESNVLVSGGLDGTVRIWDIARQANEGPQGKVIGEGGLGQKIDVGAQAGGAAKKKGKEAMISPDQISAFPTKKSPVKKVKFTRMNLVVAVGCYLP